MDVWKLAEENGTVYFGDQDGTLHVSFDSVEMEDRVYPFRVLAEGVEYVLHWDKDIPVNQEEFPAGASLEESCVRSPTFTWNEAPAKLFFALYNELKPYVGKRANLKTQKALFTMLCKKMVEHGYPVTETQVTNRYKTLERAAKSLVRNAGPKASGRARKVIGFESEVREMFIKKHNINPKFLISKDGETTQEDTLTEIAKQAAETHENEEVSDAVFENTQADILHLPPPSTVPFRTAMPAKKRDGKVACILEHLREETRMQTKVAEERVACLKRMEVVQRQWVEDQKLYRESLIEDRRKRNELLEKQTKLLELIAKKLNEPNNQG